MHVGSCFFPPQFKIIQIVVTYGDGCLFYLYPIVFTDGCETFNSFIRHQNIYGNKSAPSHDISVSFATTEQLRYICEDGYISGESRRVFSIE